jgi:hypothetical protein
MKNKITFLSLIIGLILLTGCASIVSKSKYPISINSTPSEAKISITNSKGTEVYAGNTPATVKLKSGQGFFKKASYQVKFNKDGYDEKNVPIRFKVDGWYWGNLLFGGVIGMLIVDPATGAMYKLDTEFLNETLTQSTTSLDNSELRIYGINEIPIKWQEHLVLLSK